MKQSCPRGRSLASKQSHGIYAEKQEPHCSPIAPCFQAARIYSTPFHTKHCHLKKQSVKTWTSALIPTVLLPVNITVCLCPQATSTTLICVPSLITSTMCGVAITETSFNPSCPLLFQPQVYKSLSALKAQECHPLAAILVILIPESASTSLGSLSLSNMPCPSCPRLKEVVIKISL